MNNLAETAGVIVVSVIENIKIEDLPGHFLQCVNCGVGDGSILLSEYGLCRGCWEKVNDALPNSRKDVALAVARILLSRTSQRPHTKGEPKITIS